MVDIFRLPPEAHFEILLHTPVEQIAKYCRASKAMRNICKGRYSNVFWAKKAQVDYNIPLSIFKNTLLSNEELYMKLKKLYKQRSSDLIELLLDNGYTTRAAELIREFEIIRADGSYRGGNLYEIISAARRLKRESFDLILSVITEPIRKAGGRVDNLGIQLLEAYLDAVREKDAEGLKIFNKYVHLCDFASHFIDYEYENAINREDEVVANYIRKSGC